MTTLCYLVIIAQRSYSQGEFSSQCGLYMLIPMQIKNPLTHPIIILAYIVHGFGEIITLLRKKSTLLWKKSMSQHVWEQHTLLLGQEMRYALMMDPYPPLWGVGVHWNGMDSGWQQVIISLLHYIISTVNPSLSKTQSLRNRINGCVFIYHFNILAFKIHIFCSKKLSIATIFKRETSDFHHCVNWSFKGNRNKIHNKMMIVSNFM